MVNSEGGAAGMSAGSSNLIALPFVQQGREIKECVKIPVIFTCSAAG